MDINRLVDKIQQEVLDRTLKLDSLGKEQKIQIDAAYITRRFFIEKMGMKSNYVPTVDEIREYSIVYQRALELLKKEKTLEN